MLRKYFAIFGLLILGLFVYFQLSDSGKKSEKNFTNDQATKEEIKANYKPLQVEKKRPESSEESVSRVEKTKKTTSSVVGSQSDKEKAKALKLLERLSLRGSLGLTFKM